MKRILFRQVKINGEEFNLSRTGTVRWTKKTRLKSKVFSLVSFWSPPPSLRQRVKYDGWDRETGVGGPFLNLGVA